MTITADDVAPGLIVHGTNVLNKATYMPIDEAVHYILDAYKDASPRIKGQIFLALIFVFLDACGEEAGHS